MCKQICAAAVFLLPLLGGAARAEDVIISNFTFDPSELKVAVGAKVVFRNDDDIPHLVLANDGSFKSEALDTGDSFTYTFTQPGDFAYFCAMHPHMQGKIIVTP